MKRVLNNIQPSDALAAGASVAFINGYAIGGNGGGGGDYDFTNFKDYSADDLKAMSLIAQKEGKSYLYIGNDGTGGTLLNGIEIPANTPDFYYECDGALPSMNNLNTETFEPATTLVTEIIALGTMPSDTIDFEDSHYYIWAAGHSNMTSCRIYADTSAVTDMSGMFIDCTALQTLDCSGWNTSAVTDMNNMFANCTALQTLDCSGWNTSAVTDMSNMFVNCTALSVFTQTGTVTADSLALQIVGMGRPGESEPTTCVWRVSASIAAQLTSKQRSTLAGANYNYTITQIAG